MVPKKLIFKCSNSLLTYMGLRIVTLSKGKISTHANTMQADSEINASHITNQYITRKGDVRGETGQNFGRKRGTNKLALGRVISTHETNCAMATEQRKTLTEIKILDQQHCLYKLQVAKTRIPS